MAVFLALCSKSTGYFYTLIAYYSLSLLGIFLVYKVKSGEVWVRWWPCTGNISCIYVALDINKPLCINLKITCVQEVWRGRKYMKLPTGGLSPLWPLCFHVLANWVTPPPAVPPTFHGYFHICLDLYIPFYGCLGALKVGGRYTWQQTGCEWGE